MQLILKIKNLTLNFSNGAMFFDPPSDLNLEIYEGECLGIWGKSGCGKTSILSSILNVDPSIQKNGNIQFMNEDITFCSQKFLGHLIASVFQSPRLSLNPSMKIIDQMTEGLKFHKKISSNQAYFQAIEWLEKLEISNPEKVANSYPHEISGGQRQRVCLGSALMMKPKLLLLDEPTTALDNKLEELVEKILKDQMQNFKTAILLISHDESFLKRICHRIFDLNTHQWIKNA